MVFGDDHPDVFQKTKFVGPVVVQNNIVVNNVIDINFIQQQTNTKVTVVEPKPVNDPGQAAADASGNTIAVFAPQIAKPQQTEAPKQSVDEQQAQQIVIDVVFLVHCIGERGGRFKLGFELAADFFMLALKHLAPAQMIYRAVLCHRGEPGTGIGRNA